jgi:phenylacetic acid degradation operon negative regulatory protein
MRTTARQPTPRSSIVTVFGAFVRDIGNWIAISDLVVLLGDLTIDEPAARSAIARLKRSGLLESHTHRGSAGYAATGQLLAVLSDGDARIFHSEIAANLDDGWVVVVFSVPESERDQRHLLRSRLAGLGCGPLAPGVWIAPRRVAPDVRRMLVAFDLDRFTHLVEGTYAGFAEMPALAAATWDTEPLARHYASFGKRHQRTINRWDGHDHGPRGAFIDYVASLHDWRRLAYADPGLPDELTGFAMQRRAAQAVFNELSLRLAAEAMDYVAATVGQRRLTDTRGRRTRPTMRVSGGLD